MELKTVAGAVTGSSFWWWGSGGGRPWSSTPLPCGYNGVRRLHLAKELGPLQPWSSAPYWQPWSLALQWRGSIRFGLTTGMELGSPMVGIGLLTRLGPVAGRELGPNRQGTTARAEVRDPLAGNARQPHFQQCRSTFCISRPGLQDVHGTKQVKK